MMALMFTIFVFTLMIKINSFKFIYDYCTNNDLYIHPDIIMKESEFGRGIFATADIDADVIILSIPVQCCIFQATIKTHTINTLPTFNFSHEQFDALFTKMNDVAFALYLTQLNLLKQSDVKSNHYFFPYFDQLPKTPANTPLFWNSSLIKLIKHTEAYQRTLEFSQQISKVLKHYNLTNIIKPFHAQLFWAFTMVSSRLWDIKIRKPFVKTHNIALNKYHQKQGKYVPIFVPVADMMNHNPNKVTTFLKYNQTTETVNVLSYDEIDANDEIFINYGRKCNSRLVSQYGFVMADNPYKYSEFDLYLVKNDPNLTFKQILLNKFDFTKLQFTDKGLGWKSAKGYYIAALTPKMFDSHIISKIMSVPHNSYWTTKINKLNDTNNNDNSKKQNELWLNQINTDELAKITSKLKPLNVDIESGLREALFERFSMLEYYIGMQRDEGINYKSSMCNDVHENQKFCNTLEMILIYLKHEINTLNSCKSLYSDSV
eukprot:318865_1